MLTEGQIQGVIANIIRREGGTSNDPNDLGGETHFGVTIPFAGQWGIPWPPTQAEAAQGYRRMLAGTHIDQIPDAATLDLVADCAVNHGAGRAIGWLQTGLEGNALSVDGIIGQNTLAAMEKQTGLSYNNWPLIYKAILKERGLFYAEIIHDEFVNHPDRPLKDSQVKFIDGWFNRLFSFL